MTDTILAEGAEAKIILTDSGVNKNRIQKTYRHPQIDSQIRKRRTKHEAKILHKAKEYGVNVPEVFNLNKKLEPTNKFNLEIEYIDGERLSETLNNKPENEQLAIMKKLGKEVAILHENDIIHGDLTTSNTILKSSKVYIIDFGLGFISKKIEDKAVDLHLIKQALEAKHWEKYEKLFKAFEKGYLSKGSRAESEARRYKHPEAKKIIERLIVVEKRGRYKH
jgi:TP53 regulating kinase-like protein